MSTSSKRPKSPPPPQNEDEAYARRMDEQNRVYEREYAKWVHSLSDKERRELERNGLLKPIHETHRVSGHAPSQDRDMAESSLARTEIDVGTIDEPTAPIESTGYMSPGTLEVVRRVIGSLISEQNVKISTTALAFALGLDSLNGLGSLRKAALNLCVSVEALSKKKRQWEAELSIPPNAFAKSAKAKAALSIAQQTKHWKKRTWTHVPAPSAARSAKPTA